MSVFSDKRVFGIKRQNCGGVSTAGQVCANDVILWVIFLLPINIVIHGAGQCLVAMGLFVGNVVGWIFLSKRMNSYAEISPKKIHNAPELFAARYGSWKLKDLVSVIWIVTLGLILVFVLKVIVSVVAYFMDMPESISLAIIVSFLILATILVDNKLMGIIKTIVFIMVIIVCLTMIGLVFYRMDAREILDNYRRSRLAGGTSIYLNILYYDGKTVDIGSAISMTGVGLGCIAMPLMYKGVLNIRDIKELDVGRIWAVIFEGFTILSSYVFGTVSYLNRDCYLVGKYEDGSITRYLIDMEQWIALKRESVGADFQKIDYFKEILFDEAATPVPEVEESSLTAGMQYLP